MSPSLSAIALERIKGAGESMGVTPEVLFLYKQTSLLLRNFGVMWAVRKFKQ